jgi:hypothetical protein
MVLLGDLGVGDCGGVLRVIFLGAVERVLERDCNVSGRLSRLNGLGEL